MCLNYETVFPTVKMTRHLRNGQTIGKMTLNWGQSCQSNNFIHATVINLKQVYVVILLKLIYRLETLGERSKLQTARIEQPRMESVQGGQPETWSAAEELAAEAHLRDQLQQRAVEDQEHAEPAFAQGPTEVPRPDPCGRKPRPEPTPARQGHCCLWPGHVEEGRRSDQGDKKARLQ